ncbi:MAG: oligosaccharide flippase family protein [Candidatus Bathyarchaeota archaeon]|nr:oligosaccharide flippase family protein [Candidatus Bathyarchaeota archaeon]
MDKALELGKSSALGSFHLLIGVVGGTVILAVGTLILATLLSPEGVGLYGMALIPFTMISFFRDWGINNALIQKIASLKAQGKTEEIHDVIVSGIVFEIITGAALALVCFGLAWPLAYILSPADVSELSVYIELSALAVFTGALISAAGGIFVGFERMKLNSFAQIFQAVIKTALGPLLIILGFGVFGAVFAAVVSLVATGIVCILLVYFYLFRPLKKSKVGRCDIKKTLKPMISFGLPLTVSNVVIGVLPQFFTFVMAAYAGTWMMGNYFAGTYFAVILTFVSFPIQTVLFPMFSKVNPDTEPKLVKTVFASSIKYTALLLVPATMLLITLAEPLVNTLFPAEGILQSLFVANAAPKYPYAPIFLILSILVDLLVLIGNISLVVFQSGVGQTRQVMKQSILSLAVGLPLAYGLVAYFAEVGGPALAVVGGIIGAMIANFPGMFWGLSWIWRKYGVKADFVSSAKIFLASLIASGATYLLITVLSIAYWVISLIVGAVVFLLVFLTTAPVIGAVNQMDIDNFRTMFSGLGIIAKPINLTLGFMRRMCKPIKPQPHPTEQLPKNQTDLT